MDISFDILSLKTKKLVKLSQKVGPLTFDLVKQRISNFTSRPMSMSKIKVIGPTVQAARCGADKQTNGTVGNIVYNKCDRE